MLAVSVPAAAEPTYRWVDADGVVHYSDRPQAGAEQVDIRPLPGISNPSQQIRADLLQRDQADEADQSDEPVSYSELRIASPAPEQTLWNIGATLQVQLQVQPSLAPEHQFRVVLDGSPAQGGTASQPNLTISEVYRGAHTIRAQVIDGNGATVIESEPVTFYVQQTSVRN